MIKIIEAPDEVMEVAVGVRSIIYLGDISQPATPATLAVGLNDGMAVPLDDPAILAACSAGQPHSPQQKQAIAAMARRLGCDSSATKLSFVVRRMLDYASAQLVEERARQAVRVGKEAPAPEVAADTTSVAWLEAQMEAAAVARSAASSR
ncbi:MAG: hypothetical protein KGJ97_12110 [Xanthomonadaceae bacterium]|jgi:hypothetical protein|nr:hypothetical protein [Xanthomonadaceae bacterium]MDE3071347.1 hypothetical protein [Pseudomonadota bacterium]